MERISSIAHRILLEALKADAIVVDLTMGNGNDTLFACQHFKHVYAFDVQIEALQKTQEKCKAYTNLTLHHASHADLSQYIFEPVNAYIFNGGYLPHSASTLTTHSDSSLSAFSQAISLLKQEGLLVLSFYRKHPGGQAEYEVCSDGLNQNKNIHLERMFHYDNDPLSPILLVFKKL